MTTPTFPPSPAQGETAGVSEELANCTHRKIIWAADGVDGVCKECKETVLPRLKSLPPQSD